MKKLSKFFSLVVSVLIFSTPVLLGMEKLSPEERKKKAWEILLKHKSQGKFKDLYTFLEKYKKIISKSPKPYKFDKEKKDFMEIPKTPDSSSTETATKFSEILNQVIAAHLFNKIKKYRFEKENTGITAKIMNVATKLIGQPNEPEKIEIDLSYLPKNHHDLIQEIKNFVDEMTPPEVIENLENKNGLTKDFKRTDAYFNALIELVLSKKTPKELETSLLSQLYPKKNISEINSKLLSALFTALHKMESNLIKFIKAKILEEEEKEEPGEVDIEEEEEEEKKRELEEKQRKAAEEKKRELEEKQRKAAEEKKRELEEKQRKATEEKKRELEEKQRKAAEEKKRELEEKTRKAAEKEKQRKAEESKKLSPALQNLADALKNISEKVKIYE